MTVACTGEDAAAPDVAPAVRMIEAARAAAPMTRAVLAGLSGGDGSGKGFVAAALARRLRAAGQNVAILNVDPWLSLPSQRFDPRRPAAHYYENGLRLDEMFDRLVLPLWARRSISIEFDAADATDTEAYQRQRIDFHDVDVVVLDGIFFFKRDYQAYFDVRLWVDCTLETALERALARRQENLSPDVTVRDYRTVYFPAQRLHARIDQPRLCAHATIRNDPRLAERAR